MTKTTFRAAGATCPMCGTPKTKGCDCASRDLAWRQRNAAMKDAARQKIPLEAWVPVVRAACGRDGHTAEQNAERAEHVATIRGHAAFEDFEPEFFARWSCSRLKKVAGEVRSGEFDARLKASGAPSPEEAKRQARQARELAAREAEMTAAIAEATIRGAERRENEELDALALEVFGVSGNAVVYVDSNGIRDPYSSPQNKSTARAAARIVAAGRQRFEKRMAAAAKAREGHTPTPPADPYEAALKTRRAALGIPEPEPKERPEGHAPPDPYGAQIRQARAARGIDAPAPVRAEGYAPPDPYQRQIEQRRAAQAAADEELANRSRRRR